MERLVQVGSYSQQTGLRLEWAYGFVVEASTAGRDIMIRANQAGLVSLAQHLLTLAGEEVPAGAHVHLEPGEELEDGSQPLIIERLDVAVDAPAE